MGGPVPSLTWTAFHALYSDLKWGTHAYGWTFVEEQVESTDGAGRSVVLGILVKDEPPKWGARTEPTRWGVWFEWWNGELGVNGLWEDQVPADTMMQVVPVRPVPATRWEVVV